jgi:TRAP-type C4-dicarboxylate transport system substrate-binding protein
MRVDGKRRRAVVCTFAGVALAVVACGGSGSDGDKAGGAEQAEPQALTMAQPNGEPPPQLLSWAEEVIDLSGGTLEIEFKDAWRIGETDYESRTIEDVKAGKVDMGWVGARAFDTVGVNSFQALVAPLLVDSHDLQAAVFEAGIPDQMLEGVEEIDLVGIGVLPGPMRKVLGVSKPFVEPADFAGTIVGMQDSAVADKTLTALGATPQPVPSSAELDGLDGYEQQLSSILSNHYSTEAEYVTANVNLWPRPLVMVIRTNVFESLAPEQQDALRQAAAAALPAALDDSRADDDDAAPALCREGMTLAVASESDLAELRAALQPLYEELDADPEAKAHLDAILDLKAELNAAPEAPTCPASDTESATASDFPDGTYEMTLTKQEAIDGCMGVEAEYDETLFELTLDAGSLQQFVELGGRGGKREAAFTGTYEVFRDRIELSDSMGTMSARWSFDGKNLTFTDLAGGECGDVTVWTTHPWVLVTPADAPAE